MQLVWDIKRCSIIEKLINGISEWTPSELQYHQNFPKDIENALILFSGSIANCVYSHGILLVPSYYGLSLRTLLSRYFTQRGLRVRRLLTVTNAVALAKYTDDGCNKMVAVIVLGNNHIDLSVLLIGDGVLEVKFAIGRKLSILDQEDTLFEVCIEYLKKRGDVDGIHAVDECVVVSEGKLADRCMRIIEQTFEVRPTIDTDFRALYDKGMFIQKEILDGKVQDVLILDVSPYSIHIDVDGILTQELPRFNTLPTRRSFVIDVPSSGIVVVSEGDENNRITIGRYCFEPPANIKQIGLDIDIGANGIIETSIGPLGS